MAQVDLAELVGVGGAFGGGENLSPAARAVAANLRLALAGAEREGADGLDLLARASDLFGLVEEFPEGAGEEALARRGSEMDADALREIVLAAEEDPDERARRWRERLDGAMARSSESDWYCVLYLLAADGRGHLFEVGGESGGCKLEPVGDSDWLFENLTLFYNRLRPLLEEISSRMNLSSAVFKAYPRTTTEGSLNAARLATKVGRWLAESEQGKKLFHKYSLLVPIQGSAVGKVGWDEKALSSARLPGGGLLRGPFGWVDSDILSRIQMRVPRGCAETDFSDAEWAADDSLVPWSRLAARYPAAAPLLDPRKPSAHDEEARELLLSARNVEDSLFGASSGSGRAYTDRRLFPGAPSGRGGFAPALTGPGKAGGANADAETLMVVRSCCERVPHPEYGDFIQRTLYCQGIELESAPLCAWRRDPGTGERLAVLQADGRPKLFGMPYFVGHYSSLPDSLWGRGPVGDALDLVDALAAMDALFLKNLFDVSNTVMMHSAMNGLSPFYRRGGFMVLKHDYEKPEFYKIPVNLEQLSLAYQILEKRLEAAVGRPEVRRGELPASGTSGRTVQALVDQSQGAEGNLRFRAYQFHAKRLSRELEQIQWMAPLEVVFEGAGAGDASGVAVFRGADLEGATDIRPALENELPKDEASRLQIAERKLASGLMTRDEAVDYVKATGSAEEIDGRGQADEAARRAIARIVAMEDAEAEFFLEFAAFAQAAALGQAQARGLEPPLGEAEARRARNEALKAEGLGVEPWEDASRQAYRTNAWLNSEEGRLASGPRKALVGERYMALLDQAQVMAQLMQAGAQAQAAKQAMAPGAPGPPA